MKFKDVFIMITPYRMQIIVLITLAFVVSVITAITPFISQKMIDSGLVELNIQVVVVCALLLLVAGIVNHFLEYFQQKIEIDISNALNKKLKKDTLAHGFRISPKHYKDHSVYKILGDALYDIDTIMTIAQTNFLIFFAIIFKTIGASIGFAILDWRLALCVAAFMPLKYLFNRYISNRATVLGDSCLAQNKKYNSWFDDVMHGVVDIKLWNLNKKKEAEYDTLIWDINSANKKMQLLYGKNSLLTNSMQDFLLNSIYIVGTYMILGKSLSLGGLISFIFFYVPAYADKYYI